MHTFICSGPDFASQGVSISVEQVRRPMGLMKSGDKAHPQIANSVWAM
jgi:hypothetical protein